jgi:DNA repair exonuclease SbcCD ATPase subunit
MKKIITSFEEYNESKHTTTIAESITDTKKNVEKDKDFFDDAKTFLTSSKTYKIKDAESKSFFSKLEEDIKDLSDCIKEKNKSKTILALKRVKNGIEKCNFK